VSFDIPFMNEKINIAVLATHMILTEIEKSPPLEIENIDEM